MQLLHHASLFYLGFNSIILDTLRDYSMYDFPLSHVSLTGVLNVRSVINEEEGHITIFIMASDSLNVLITWLENFQILRQFPFMVSQFDSTVTNQLPQDDTLKSVNCDSDFLSTSLSPKMSS